MLDAAHHVLPVVAAGVGVGSIIFQRIFGSDDEIIAVAGADEFADDLFAGAELIDVGGVEEITAGIGEGVHDVETGGSVRTPSGFSTEAHGAKTKFGDFETAASEEFVFHGCKLGFLEEAREAAMGRNHSEIAAGGWCVR